MKAKLIYHLKQIIFDRYILEEVIHLVNDKKKYPENVKYSLIFFDTKTQNKILMDNHHPKSHHLHINDIQIPYKYKDENQLIEDFKNYIYQHMGVKI